MPDQPIPIHIDVFASHLRIPAEADQHSWMKPITIPV
jgi:hypothetical protein